MAAHKGHYWNEYADRLANRGLVDDTHFPTWHPDRPQCQHLDATTFRRCNPNLDLTYEQTLTLLQPEPAAST